MIHMDTERRLELGCGAAKPDGFLGLDRYPLPGVDVVADLDAPLPFPDNTFDLLLGFHSLEHVVSLTDTMREVCRVAKPGAQVVIGAPYATMQLNLANPYHLQSFNEHTPRFWTNAGTCSLDPAEWQQPPLGAQWGLARSDNSNPGFDLRTLRMEFFYFAEFARLDRAAQRYARRHYLDVCEQILYHLVVFKPPITEQDVKDLKVEFYLPPQLEERRRAAWNAAPAPSLFGRLLGRFFPRRR